MIISKNVQIYKAKLYFPNFFLHFHQKALIFPSTRFLFCSIRDKKTTNISNNILSGTPPHEMEDVPL